MADTEYFDSVGANP